MDASPSAGLSPEPQPDPGLCRVVVLAKATRPGRVKTRLAATIGHPAAAALARRMLDHTLRQALQAGLGPVRLCGDPHGQDEAFGAWCRDDRIERTAQAAGDLGERMAAALHDAALDAVPGGGRQPGRVLLLGTDAPDLDAGRLRRAAERLKASSLVFVPALDGGYALVGLRMDGPVPSGPLPEHRSSDPTSPGPTPDWTATPALDRLLRPLVRGIPWSTPQVMETTRMQLFAAAIDWAEEPAVCDIDTADDLPADWPPGF